MLIHLRYSTPSNEVQAKNVRTTLCKSWRRSVGVQPDTIHSPPDSDGSRTPPVVSKALADSKPTRKESHGTLQCPLDSESVPKRQVLTDGHQNPDHAHRDPIHRATQVKTHHQNRLNHCYQSEQHPSDSSIPQKECLLKLSLPKNPPNLAHAHTAALLHGQLTAVFFRMSGRLP
jgi:hypothetical protein